MTASEFAGACRFERAGAQKFAVVDVGSNSVRLLLLGELDEKYVATTRLGAGLNASGALAEESMRRTAQAVQRFAARARAFCGGVFLFGTEAVRKASNRETFRQMVWETCGEELEVLSGEEEALCGFLGVSDGTKALTVLDIGGASTELASGSRSVESSVSIPLGTVRLCEACGRDRRALDKLICEKLDDFPVAAAGRLTGIGGTATTVASTLIGKPGYHRELVHGFSVERKALGALADRLFSLTIEEIARLPGMDPRRADVIAGGAELMKLLMERLGFHTLEVSESDNLEGYLRFKKLI